MTDTPDEVLKQILEGLKAPPPVDISSLSELMTDIGREVLNWLVVQPWFRGRPEAKILERKEQGDRYEIKELREFPDGSETVSLIFFREDGHWKFHDLFLHDMRGTRFNMFLSYVLREPIKANVQLYVQNPTLPPWLRELLEKVLKAAAAKAAAELGKKFLKKGSI